jgi:hypothetical protein
MEEHFPSKHKALSSNPDAAHKKAKLLHVEIGGTCLLPTGEAEVRESQVESGPSNSMKPYQKKKAGSKRTGGMVQVVE